MVGATIGNAQTIESRIAQIADSLCYHYGDSIFPGTVVLVVKDDETVFNKGYGLANMEYNIPNSPSTAFYLGSVSKMFTGYAISLLIEQGKISAEDNIRKYLTKLPDYGHTVTIDHLLHHTSGIPNDIRLIYEAGWSLEDRITYDQLLRLTYAQKKLNFPPGEKFEYSNTGYLFLAEIVSKVTGMSFREWTQQNIFDTLQMTQSTFVDDQGLIIPNKANSYYLDHDGELKVSPNNSQVPGPSSLVSNTTDLAKWAKFLHNPPDKLKPVLERMFTKGILNDGQEITVGYSVRLREYDGLKWIIHQGHWPNFFSLFVYFPELKLTVATLSNYKRGSWAFANEISALYQPVTKEKKPDPSPDRGPLVSASLLKSYTGTYHLSPGFYMKVSLKDNRLFSNISFDREEVFPMTAISDSTYYIEDYRWKYITFMKDKSGVVTHAIYDDNVCPKVPDVSGSNPKKEDYVGRYVSDEIETLYLVKYEENQLTLNHLRIGPQKINHVRNDDFLVTRWEGRFPKGIMFTRDTNGNINGFQMENHFFTKIDESN